MVRMVCHSTSIPYVKQAVWYIAYCVNKKGVESFVMFSSKRIGLRVAYHKMFKKKL